MTDIFTFDDFIAGNCQREQVGFPKSEQSEQSEQPPDQQTAEFDETAFDSEWRTYQQDPATYKARHAPAIVTKLLELSERRRTESMEAGRQRRMRIKDCSTVELERRLLLAVGLPDQPPPIPSGTPSEAFRSALQAGIDHLVSLPTLQERQSAAEGIRQFLAMYLPDSATE